MAPKARPVQFLLWAGIVGPIIFVVTFTIDGALTPGYSAIRDAVSYLALGRYGWIQAVNFVVLGILVIAFALGFFRWWRRRDSSWVLPAAALLIALSGLGYVLAAIFTANRPPQPPGPKHTLAFEIVFFAQGLGCLLVGLRLLRRGVWRGLGWMSLIIMFLTVAAAAGNLSSIFTQAPRTPISSPSGAFPLGGLFNRVLVLIAFIWYLVFAGRMLSDASADSA